VQELAVDTVDYHTGGEPFRIVAESPVPIPGDCVADRRARAIADPAVDGLRQVLCFEPRGHADMYGCFITPPDDAGADFGVLFWHKDGFSTACGHGTIALGVWAVDSGRVVPDPDGITDVTIDVPSGRVVARVRTGQGRSPGSTSSTSPAMRWRSASKPRPAGGASVSTSGTEAPSMPTCGLLMRTWPSSRAMSMS
jgi:proline racemase